MSQIYISELVGLRVYKYLAPEKRTKGNGKPRRAPRLGKVHQAIFSPDGLNLVGFTVKLPDTAGIIKREDEFVAFDGFDREEDGLHLHNDVYATGMAARERLGLVWDSCLIWDSMDVRMESGKTIGRVSDVRFDSQTGAVSFIHVSGGGLSDQLIGVIELPSGLLLGYQDGFMVVDDRVEELGFTGGLAGKAGEAKALAQEKLSEAGTKAAEVGQEGLEGAARFLGRQYARTKGMFSDFKREFDEANK